MLERLKRILVREIDVPVLVRTLAATVVLAIAFALSWYGYYSPWRHDLEVATSILVIGVLAYGIYAALNAGRFERAESAGEDGEPHRGRADGGDGGIRTLGRSNPPTAV